MKEKISALLATLMLFIFSANAQKVDIRKIEVAGEKIVVHYDLEDGNPNNEYQINLFTSQNNFAKAMTKVEGDVGSEIKIGQDRKIIWNAKEELGAFTGKIAVEVRGKVFVPVAKFNSISTATKFKRGKAHEITWKPGNSNAVHIELLNGSQRIAGELNQPNNGKFSLFVPEHTAIGKDYTIRITDSRNSDDVIFSPKFSITRKVPLLLKAVPVIAIGGLVAMLAGGGSGGGGGGGSTGPSDIPSPPALPGN